MTQKSDPLFFLALGLLLFLSTGCRNEVEPGAVPQGQLLSRTGCLMTVAGNMARHQAIDVLQECLSYRSLPGGVVMLSHEGAVFNCEPGEITSTVCFNDNTIEIREYQSQNGAYCLCPYNLEFRLSDLDAAVYHLTLHTYDDRILQIDIRTEAGTSDRICQDSPLP